MSGDGCLGAFANDIPGSFCSPPPHRATFQALGLLGIIVVSCLRLARCCFTSGTLSRSHPSETAAYICTVCCAQACSFFADAASDGVRIAVEAGETLLIPGGWPHAVVTPEDSVVVGGNFLHGLDFRSAGLMLLQ